MVVTIIYKYHTALLIDYIYSVILHNCMASYNINTVLILIVFNFSVK